MSVQFEWQSGNDDGQWEVVAKTERRSLFKWVRRVPRWVWVALVVALVLAATSGYFVVRNRYEAASREIAFQIQNVIDLEARAFAQGDDSLFLAQQDAASADWYAYQELRVQDGCASPPSGSVLPQEQCDPVLPAQIEDVELRGDLAWVQVLESEGATRRARFYRRTEQGWKQTAPRIEFWRTPIELTYGDLVFGYHRRDEPYVEPLIERIYETATTVCATVNCPPLSELAVVFAADAPPDQRPALQENTLVLPSPWLSGVPADGTWDEADLDELTYWVARELTLRALRASSGRSWPLHQALATEYAAWYAWGEAAQAPILEHLLEEWEASEMPAVFRSLPQTRTLSAFLSHWLSLWPDGQEIAFFETLLNIEREALRLGYKDTFLLFQGNPNGAPNRHDGIFEYVQTLNLSPSVVEVEKVVIDDSLATVTVRGPWAADGSLIPQSNVLYLERDGDWRHLMLPIILLLGDAPPSHLSSHT
jgi:hypothetical protein